MFPCLRRASLFSFHLLALQPTFSAAYSWVLSAPSIQCSNLSISITGSGGVPPYHALVVPFGATTLSKEVRSVIAHPFDGNSTTTSFAINYPENSQFVAVVSDAAGFGTGGIGAPTKISESEDSSCFNVSNPYSAAFYFYVSNNQFTQCQSSRIWWDASTVEGTPSFLGIIPGGQSFTIQDPNITISSKEGTGFSWTAAIQGDTTLVIVGSDNRGIGAGGYATFTINFNDDTSCLNGLSPSSTLGTPPGATSTAVNRSSSGSDSGRRAKTTALVGGIVGGVAGGLLLGLVAGTLIYFLRRNRKTGQATGRGYLSQYKPEPFVAMRPTSETTKRGSGQTSTPLLSPTRSGDMSGGSGRPSEFTSLTTGNGSSGYFRPSEFGSRIPSSDVPDSSQREPWNVDVIQHEDSGLTLIPPSEQRVVELPPRYDNIGTRDSPSLEILLQSHGTQDPF